MSNTEHHPTNGTTPETSPEPTAVREHLRGKERTRTSAGLKKRYDGGATIRDLAEETGRSYGSVHRLLTESKTILRGRGGAPRRRRGDQLT